MLEISNLMPKEALKRGAMQQKLDLTQEVVTHLTQTNLRNPAEIVDTIPPLCPSCSMWNVPRNK
jgi:hypothetical protein